jgi:hypothetical protein
VKTVLRRNLVWQENVNMLMNIVRTVYFVFRKIKMASVGPPPRFKTQAPVQFAC